jgi:hypothetical protein
MLKIPKYAVTVLALAVVCLLAAPAVSFAESGMGKQLGPTKIGDKSTAKRAPTHKAGTVITHNPNALHLMGPAIHASGMGKLEGAEKQGDKTTPKRAPTTGAKPA